DALYTYAIIGGLVIASVYYGLRLRIEARKEQASRASLEAMVKYHSQRLDIETEKLEIARDNAGGKTAQAQEPTGVLAFGKWSREHSRKLTPGEWENLTKPLESGTIRVRDHVKPPEPMMSDEEFAATVKRIREMMRQ